MQQCQISRLQEVCGLNGQQGHQGAPGQSFLDQLMYDETSQQHITIMSRFIYLHIFTLSLNLNLTSFYCNFYNRIKVCKDMWESTMGLWESLKRKFKLFSNKERWFEQKINYLVEYYCVICLFGMFVTRTTKI